MNMQILSQPKNSCVYFWWHKDNLSEPAFITYTQEDLKNKIKELKLDNFIENRIKEITPNQPETLKGKIELLLFQDENKFGEYLVKDLQTVCNLYISGGNPDMVFKNYCIMQYDNITILKENDIIDSNKQKPNIFFTKPNKVKNNIENGKFLIQNIKNYRQIPENQDKSGRYDATEGIESAYYLEDYKIKGSKGGQCNIQKTYLTAHENIHNFFVHCFHDENIPDDVRSNFGENTYQITNIEEWIKNVYNKLVGKFQKKDDYFAGSYIFFKKVDYSDKKIVKIPPQVVYSDDKLSISPSNYKEWVKDFPPLPKPKNIIETIDQTCFQKTSEYKKQNEWRLVIYPFFIKDNKFVEIEDEKIFIQLENFESLFKKVK